MSARVSALIAVLVAPLLAFGAIAATPMAANARTTSTYTLSGSFSNTAGAPGTVYFEVLDGDIFDYAGSTTVAPNGSFSAPLPSGYYRVTALASSYYVPKHFVTISGQNTAMASAAATQTTTTTTATITAPQQDSANPITATISELMPSGAWQAISTGSYSGGSISVVVPGAPGTAYRLLVSDPSGTYKPRALGSSPGTFTDGVTDVSKLSSAYDLTGAQSFTDPGAASLALVSSPSTGSFTYLGNPVPNATVTFWKLTGGSFVAGATTTTDANGQYSAPLVAGSYTVSASATGYSDVAADATNTVQVSTTGAADFGVRTFSHKNGTTVSGTVIDKWGDVYAGSVTLQVKGSDGSFTNFAASGVTNPLTLDANGAYSWTVPAGVFRVTIAGATSAEFTVDPSAVVAPIEVADPNVPTPTDTNNLPPLAAASVGTVETAPTITWIGNWSTKSVQWNVDGNLVSSAATYTPTAAQVGSTLSAVITGHNGTREFAVGITGVVIGKGTLASNGVSFTGIENGAHVGDVLTVDADWGTDGTIDSWVWTRGGVTVSTSSTYTLTDADLTQTLSVAIHGVKAGYLSSDQTGSITVPKGSLDTVTISQTGAGTIGSALVASTSALPAGTTLTIRWYSHTTDGDLLLSQGVTHTITGNDFSNGLYVKATAPATARYAALSERVDASLTELPLDGAAAAVAGTLAVGQTLTGSITGGPSGTAAQNAHWQVGASTTNGANFVVTSDQLGEDLTFTADAAALGYSTTTVTTTVHIVGATQTTGIASITGIPTVGQPLAGLVTSWVTPSTPSISRGWFIDGVQVSSNSTYVVQPADQGKTIVFSVTGTASGYENGIAQASVKVPFAAFTAGTPTMTGTSSLGSVLTAATGSWPTGVSLDIQWLRNGVNIPGENGLTHTVNTADLGTTITFRVTGSRPNYATQIATVSTAIPAEAPAVTVTTPTVVEKIVTVTKIVTVHTFGTTPAPKISGKAKVGSTLKAKTATWKPTSKFTYRWYANGKPISGATKSSLKLTRNLAGKKITITATGKKTGYQTESATSKSTVKVVK